MPRGRTLQCWIPFEHPGNVFEHDASIGAKFRGQENGREIGPAAAQDMRPAVGAAADEPGKDHHTMFRERIDEGLPGYREGCGIQR